MTQDQNSLRHPLAHARGHGSAHSGTHHWWMQRVTGVMLVVLTLFLLWHLDSIVSADLDVVKTWLKNPLAAVGLLLFIGAAFYHGYLGVQVVIEDYVHGAGCKIALLLANKIFFAFLGAAAVFSVLRISFGL